MSIVRVEEEIQPLKYLVITQERDPESVITTNVIISDTRFNRLNLVSIEKGPQGDTGAQGPVGPAGQDGVSFEILPINSGGTNNTSFSSGNIIYYDGNKLSSSNYTFEDLLNSSNANTVTGIFSGSGLYRELVDNTVTLGVDAGDGLAINEYNQIVVDDTIVRKVELSIGNISGVVPIAKGGTNNQTFNSNRLLYYDGFKITSFPLATGRILLSGTTIDIVAGSGLTGGGSLTLPSGSVVLNIGESSDILVENNSISLSTTGTPGTYSKITTDVKGRVVSGSNLTQSDIISILGYTPWHPGNDGQDSGLDADLLDGNDSTYFTNASNLTGLLDLNIIPSSIEPGVYTKVYVNDKGMVTLGDTMNYGDVVYSLGYRPVSSTGDLITGPVTINGDVNLNGDNLIIRDNLPTIGTNSASILPSDPRGFTFLYGGFTPKTGILAFYPADRELKLITNINSSGEISGGENGFIGDVDGGDQNAIYISNNVSGDINVILLRGKADTLYVSRTDTQVISGVKTFVNGVQVRDQVVITPLIGQSNPPLNVGSNNIMVENLNVDLLHGHDSDYFTDASNITGLFTYEKVEFDNLDGTPNYIPRFDNRTSNPSRTISNSIIRQKGDDTAIIIENNANLYVGSSNSGSFLVNNSIVAGSNNKIFNDNSLAIGTNNIISGDNSIALNYGSKTLKDKSIAAGNYGYTWNENQLSFGAFAEFDSDQTITQGQYSTIALGLNSTETDGSWTNMSPSVILPKDKTIAYTLEVLMNKAAGTGAVLTVFDSGIIKNTTFRSPTNPAQTVNVTSVLKNHTKKEIYNDSQQRRHYYHYKLEDNTVIQNLEVTAPPVKSFGEVAQNIDSVYKYTPQFISATGSYVKTNDGNTILTVGKPVFSGSFLQNSGDYRIKVISYDHGMATGCLANLTFSSGLIHNPISKQYTVLDIIDQDQFRVSENFARGYLTGDEIVIDPDSISSVDSSNSIVISGGYLYTNSPDMYNMPFNVMTILHTGMKVRFRPYESLYPSIAEQTGIIIALTSGSVTFNVAFTGAFNSSSVNTPSVLTFNSYSDHSLSSCSKLYVNIEGYGQQALPRVSGSYPTTYCGQPSIAFKISGVPQNFSGTPVRVAPGSLNSGLLTLHNKRSFTGTYAKSATRFKRYDGIYTQYPSSDGTSKLSIFNRELQKIELPSVPFSYSLSCGYGDTDNPSFSISGDYVVSIESLDFDTYPVRSIHVKSTDMSGRYIEKSLTINASNIQSIDNDSPLLLTNITLSENNISGLIPSGYVIGKLDTAGGYYPHLVFRSSSNSFSGVLISGSNIISECSSINLIYTTVTLTGTPDTIYSGMLLSSIDGLNSAAATGVADPIEITGIISNGSYVLSGISPVSLDSISGVRFLCSESGWNNQARVTNTGDSSIIFNVPFTGTGIDVNIVVYNVGKRIFLDSAFNSASCSTLITYSGTFPNNDAYYPSGLQYFSSGYMSGICPSFMPQSYIKGFSSETSQYIVSTGHYVTGIVSFYTEAGYNDITIIPDQDTNIESNEDSVFINYTSANHGDIPTDTAHSSISGYDGVASFMVHNLSWYPDSGVSSTGSMILNLNQNHGYQILNTKILNQIPVQFDSCINNNSNRKPKNNLFDILAITGNQISIKDSQNYLLKENGKPDYFEQEIRASYSTNGFNFNATIISGNNSLYDCSTTGVFNLEKNMTLGCSSFAGVQHPVRVDSLISGVSFNGTVYSGQNILTTSTGLGLYQYQRLYSSLSGWSDRNIYITSYISGIVALSTGINWIMDEEIVSSFYTLPIIIVNQNLCISQNRQQNNRVFYNGNIITINGLSTPRIYLNTDDQIKISAFNGSDNFSTNSISQYSQILRTNASQTLFSGIAINGSKNIEPLNQDGNDPYRRNQYRHSDSFGLDWNTELPNVGSLSFIGSCSGFCNIPYFNNIYYHSYGGSTAEWPMDTYGNLVDAPKTGIFTVSSTSNTCQSGALCINIRGFENTDFNNIPDIISRNNIGKTSNTTNDNKGYVRPWGVDKKFYFDFSDGAPSLNGSYYITDKIDPYNFTITIPYNSSYLGTSGLVYIVDSDYNLKTNKNPNINNDFIVSNGSINISGTDNSLFALGINSYNNQSKRWKHLIHFSNSNLPTYSGYTTTIQGQSNGQLLYLNPNKIEIIGIDYSLDYGQTYSSILDSSSFGLPSTVSQPVYLKIQTKNGSEKWSSSLSKAAPRVNIFGIANYTIDNENILYNTINKTWTINIIITDIMEILDNRDITIRVSDETGFDSITKTLNIQLIPEIRQALPSYIYLNGEENWSLTYDIKYLKYLTDHNITMSGFAGPSFNIANETFSSDSNETKIIYGYPGTTTGIYHPVLHVRDYLTNEVLSTSTGEIHILGPSETIPAYNLNPIGLDDDIYLDIDNNTNTNSFYFYIPAINGAETNLVVTLGTDLNYTIETESEYSTASSRYKVIVTLTGNAGYYPSKNITIAISQPVIDEYSVVTWVRHTFNKNINLTLYKDFQISTSQLTQPLVYDKQEIWSIQFDLVGGILSHRSDIHPTVRLTNLPNIGTYENQPLEYSLNYTYNSINHRWHVEAVGKTDTFGKVTDNIGPKTIDIYADDTLSIATKSVDLLFTQTQYLDNIQPTIYSIPNKAYQNTLDIKQADVDTYPSISIPGNLKENTINLSRYYRKYDPDFNLWEYSYSGEPIIDRWDIDIGISNTGTPLSSSQFSTITAKCKGIATDKIQAVGKLSLIELDSFSVGGLPIKITGISYPSYTIAEGSPWEITFKTIFGLENPNFPPTILLSGLPSMCSGYNPSIGLEQQNTCLQYRTWSPIDKSWNFKFKGLPLCGQEGIKPFSILAIDTDTIQDIYLTSDKIETSILYTSLEENGFAHTPPVIKISGSQQDQNPIQLSPLCNSPINISYIFGPTNRESCPIPTGITGWMVSGTLPPGLGYTISFSGGNPSAPWNNLSSGVITFTGNPTTFANGSLYSQQFGFKVFDARNKSTQKIFTFQDTSSANPPSPLNLTVYFDDEKPKYTPIRNMVAGETVSPPQGTRPIDKANYPNITTYWPPAYSGSLSCTSTLPHNQCQTCEFYYSGGNYEELDYKVYLQFSRQLPLANISDGNKIYLEFDYNPENEFNNLYTLKYSSPNYYVEVPGQTFTTGSGRLVRERKVENVPTYDIQKFNGSLDSNTTKSILGCGSFSSKASFQILDEGGYGLFGRMRPDYIATIPVSGIFNSADIFMTGLNIAQLNNPYTTGISNHIYTVKTSNCWETGYLRISGILLPAPIVELTDPAPASEAPFAYNNQQYYVGSRCAYGDTAEQRDLQDNKRDTTINYRITNLLTNSIYQNSQVSSNQAIAFNHNESYGTVFSLFLNNNPAIFPTYRYNSLRYAQNEYFWIHKGGTKNGTITQNSFPPVIIGGIKNNRISCLSGVSISGYEGVLVGGYIPFNEYAIPVPYYQLPDNSNWSTLNYSPHITGFITKEIQNTNNTMTLPYSHPGNTQSTNQYINISIGANTYGFASGDAVDITFAEGSIPPTSLLLEPVNFSGSFIRIPYNRGGSPAITNSQAYISYRSMLLSIDDNILTIKHKNIPFITGEKVDIAQGLASTCSNIAPYNYATTVSSGDSSLLYVSFDGPSSINYSGSLAISGITQVNRIYSNQINVSESIYSKEGYWLFSLNGTPTGLYQDYSYKIISVENTGMPVFSGTSLTPKTYSKSYPLYINKPLKINLPQIVIDSGIVNNNGSWSLTFNTDGGLRPIYNNKPEVMINGEICNFNRQLSSPNMLDTYDVSTDSWQISLTNNNNFDWRYQTSFELMIFDETGFDTKTIYFNNPQ
jgi:hypothetical protein